MKRFLIICMALLSLSQLGSAKETKYTARVTYYSAFEGDGYGNKVACPKTKRAEAGVTVAAHPDFKFGTKVSIPALSPYFSDTEFIVQDRGSAITRKKASSGKAYVFDVFVASNQKIREMSKKMPRYVTVIVYENN